MFIQQAFQESRLPLAQPQHMPLPAEVPTLAEIEHKMMARENQKPRVLTAEELERQLRGEPPRSHEQKPQFTVSPQIPPAGAAVAFRKQVGRREWITTFLSVAELIQSFT